MKTSTVVHPVTKAVDERPWTLPVICVVCGTCGFPAIAVSAESVQLAVWDHVAALHLGEYDAEVP